MIAEYGYGGAARKQEINGVENMMYMASDSNSDGAMTLTITFRIGTGISTTRKCRCRTASLQALTRLPEDVRRFGVTTRKASSDLTMVVNLVSPDGRYDE